MNVRRMMLAVAVASSLASPLAVNAANVSVDVDIAPPAVVTNANAGANIMLLPSGAKRTVATISTRDTGIATSSSSSV